MTRQVDFFFDFSSAFSYVAQGKLDSFEKNHGLRFRWRPFSLGAVFKETGGAPPTPDTLKGRYIYHDVERSAREIGLPYVWPKPFPFNSILAARAFYVIAESDPRAAVAFARAVFHASYGQGKDCGDPMVFLGLAVELGIDRAALTAALGGDEARARLKAATDEALARGIFGAPMFVVGDELFWGADRLDQLARWVERGGW